MQSYHQEIKQATADSLDYSSIRKTIDDPEMVPMESVDMFTAPHFQQGRISNEYLMETLIVADNRFRTKAPAKNKYKPTPVMLDSGRQLTTLSPRKR